MTDAKTDDVTRLAKEWVALEVTRTDVVERQAQIKAELRTLFPYGGTHKAGTLLVNISENSRFTADGALAALQNEPTKLAAIMEPQVSSLLAKALLSPADYDRCKKIVGDPRVTIR